MDSNLLEGIFWFGMSIGLFICSWFSRNLLYLLAMIITGFIALILSIVVFYEYLQIKVTDDDSTNKKKNKTNAR